MDFEQTTILPHIERTLGEKIDEEGIWRKVQAQGELERVQDVISRRKKEEKKVDKEIRF